MIERQIEFSGDEYRFERARYACEKIGKKFDEVVEIFLKKKVGPTFAVMKAKAPNTDPATDRQGATT